MLQILEGAFGSDLVRAASAMAFDLFLAAIPLLALAGWLFAKLVQDDGALQAASLLMNSTPESVRRIVERQLGRFSPGAVAPIALFVSAWLGSAAAATCMQWLETESGARRRNWLERRVVAVVSVVLSVVVFGTGGAITVWLSGGPRKLLQAFVSDQVAVSIGQILGIVLVHLLAAGVLGAFFRLSTPRRLVPKVWPGAFLAAGLGALSSLAFTTYASQLADYALYYGSLAAVAVTMLWLWLVCFFVLLGAELNLRLAGRTRGGTRRRAQAATPAYTASIASSSRDGSAPPA